MPVQRTSANEAWIVSLVIHVAFMALVIAVLGGRSPTDQLPVVIDTRNNDTAISVVMLDVPVTKPIPAIAAVTKSSDDLPPNPHPRATAPLPQIPIQPVEHEVPKSAPPNSTCTMPIAPSVIQVSATAPPQAAPSAGPPLPAGVSTAFFGVPAMGKSVVFVIDRSASMGLDGRLDRARRELAESLRRLPPSARFQIIAYNRLVEPLRLPAGSALLPATPDVIATAIEQVDRLAAEGGTDHVRALTTAISFVPDVIFFLTDEDELSAADVQAVVRVNYGRVCIHSLCIIPPVVGNTPMQNLARLNRGQFKIVNR